ncbi:hypothetical protein L3X38_045455 [Prunus dulcis]|uniref:Transposable element protein n=1 Tax=Prunus dulcis TaxID=3755 RepID=A0AAD4V1X7_PRUDU|nr:hypothetical protein L3X38_045455 [Prunus dulcis]
MDDITVFGDSFSDCLFKLENVRMRCKEKILVLNWEKCQFMVTSGIVLGHIVSHKGIEVDKSKIDLIANLPIPKTVKEIRSFLGHAGLIPPHWTSQEKKKFMVEVRKFFWEDPHHFKYCPDPVIRRCVPDDEIFNVISFCHSEAYGGPFIVKRVFPYGTVEDEDPKNRNIFKVNGQQLKPYLGRCVPEDETVSLNEPVYQD